MGRRELGGNGKRTPTPAPLLEIQDQPRTPFLASLPNFPGRSTLIRARINDYDFSRVRHSVGRCPYCGEQLPSQGDESDETLSLIHFLVGCEGEGHPIADFLTSACWLPGDYDDQDDETKLALLLLLAPSEGFFSVEAHHITGAYVATVLDTIYQAVLTHQPDPETEVQSRAHLFS